MGNGVSAAAAQYPDSIDKAQARTLLGGNFDEAAFDAAATDGFVDKATILAKIAQAEAAAEAKATTTAPAAKADAESSGSGGFAADPENLAQGEVESFHSLVRWNKDVPAIEAQLASIASIVHARDAKNGNYPLHIAAQNNHEGLVRLLLAHKADPNRQNGAGQTALHMTQTYDMFALSDLLLQAGADPEKTNDAGHPAKFGLEGTQNVRYNHLKALVAEANTAAAAAASAGLLLAFLEGVRARSAATTFRSRLRLAACCCLLLVPVAAFCGSLL
jgi:hypothetical protein